MVTNITACTTTSSVNSPPFQQHILRTTPLLWSPVMAKAGEVRVRCSTKGRAVGVEEEPPPSHSQVGTGLRSLSVAAAMASVTAMSKPAAMALVDERLSTEGTGLPFGLSNNLLGWILLGVFGLIWALYFVYTSGLDEDEDSGLSL